MRKAETWAVVTQLAAAQWGLLTTAQAVRFGVSVLMMSRLAERGYLEREAWGVYRLVGTPATLQLPRQAAWLQLEPKLLLEERWRALPETGVASHASAARALDLGDLLGEVHEFTVPGRRRTRRADVVLHKATLTKDDVTFAQALPVTTAWRTVCDLAADGVDGEHVAGVLADAVRTELVDPRTVDTSDLDRAAPVNGLAADGQQLLHHLLDIGGLVGGAAAALAEDHHAARRAG
ncbi:MAG: hypothetical protein DLM61_19395 [Pseudonocardiales bacterium]|nr:MAG: hypothetical protein DLM61_19395 [Pseudonocardiales bacterium]